MNRRKRFCRPLRNHSATWPLASAENGWPRARLYSGAGPRRQCLGGRDERAQEARLRASAGRFVENGFLGTSRGGEGSIDHPPPGARQFGQRGRRHLIVLLQSEHDVSDAASVLGRLNRVRVAFNCFHLFESHTSCFDGHVGFERVKNFSALFDW